MRDTTHPARPRVTLKWAQTLDGRVATSTGHSRWISGAPARTFAHQLRAEHDAILVGVGTVLADNPELTTRRVRGPDPLPVILDSRLRTPPDAALARPGTLVATLETAPEAQQRMLESRGVEVVRLPGGDGRVDLPAVMALLAGRSIERLLVEGGSSAITAFLRLRLADEIVAVLAPAIAGAGIDAVGELHVTVMAGCICLEDVRCTVLGSDAVVRGRPIWPA